MKLKKLIGFVLKRPWQPSGKPLRWVEGKADIVERFLLETMLGFIDKALKENIITSEEAGRLRERYTLRWRQLSQAFENHTAEETIQRLIKMKQLLQQEYESKLRYLEEQIKDVQENFNQSVKGENFLNSKGGGFNAEGMSELKSLRAELLTAIERLEAMDRELR